MELRVLASVLDIVCTGTLQFCRSFPQFAFASCHAKPPQFADLLQNTYPVQVWDYASDGYVHRLIQSKTDGKLVEVPSPAPARREGDAAAAGGSGT